MGLPYWFLEALDTISHGILQAQLAELGFGWGAGIVLHCLQPSLAVDLPEGAAGGRRV